jgi:hypothetical protein
MGRPFPKRMSKYVTNKRYPTSRVLAKKHLALRVKLLMLRLSRQGLSVVKGDHARDRQCCLPLG